MIVSRILKIYPGTIKSTIIAYIQKGTTMLQNEKYSFFNRYFMKYFTRTSALLCAGALTVSSCITAQAAPASLAELEQIIARNQAVPIESNAVPNWLGTYCNRGICHPHGRRHGCNSL